MKKFVWHCHICAFSTYVWAVVGEAVSRYNVGIHGARDQRQYRLAVALVRVAVQYRDHNDHQYPVIKYNSNNSSGLSMKDLP